MAIDAEALDEALNAVRDRLLAERNIAGHWSGELSSSALSTATAIFALHELSRLPLSSSRIPGLDEIIKSGVQWLIATQRDDGTWHEEPFTGTGFPKVFYLKYHYYALYFPLMALSRYAAAHE